MKRSSGIPPRSDRPAPLAGIRVIEAANFISGPFVGLMLADLGAEVLKIEPPDGDPARRFGRPKTRMSPEFANLNRGKRSVTLDLKVPADRAALLRLVADSDVFICNWRPSVAARLGLADATLADANPQLIRVYITGYGESGPDVGAPVFDSVAQARSGLAHASSPTRDPVVIAGFPVDKETSVFATQAILAGLLARSRDGVGDRIDLAMLDTAAYFNFVDLFANRTFLDHQPAEATSRRATAVRPLPAKDGWLVLAPVAGKQYKATCQAVGHPEWADDLRSQPDADTASRLLFDRVASVLSGRTIAEWLSIFAEHDVPAAACLTVDAHLADAQVIHNSIYSIDEWPELGRVRTVRYPAIFGSGRELRASEAAPEIGQHTNDYLSSIGWADRAAPSTVQGTDGG